MFRLCFILYLCSSNILPIFGRIHHLNLEDDARSMIHINTFGFYKGGYLDVDLQGFRVDPKPSPQDLIAFTVDRTLSEGIIPYPTNREGSCGLKEGSKGEDGVSTIRFVFDFEQKVIRVTCNEEAMKASVQVYQTSAQIPISQSYYKKLPFTDVRSIIQRSRRDVEPVDDVKTDDDKVAPLKDTMDPQGNADVNPIGVQQNDQASNNARADGLAEDSLIQNSGKVDAQVAQSSSPKPNSGVVVNVSPMADVPKSSSDQPNAIKSSSVGYNDVFPHSSSEELDDASFKDPVVNQGPTISSDYALSHGITILPLNVTTLSDGSFSYSTTFTVYIAGEDCEGLYSLYFHNCAPAFDSSVNVNMSIIEKNKNNNYLSAGEMPLPGLYFMMSVLFFISGCFWVFILKRSKRETGVAVFKIHYLMGALVFLKSLSLLFHSINYHYIQIEGIHVEGWAVLFYIAHLLKGALLFITILLIGTGYAFIKHLLNYNEKRIFMIVIPLQVLANVAEIIIDESEEGAAVYTMWKYLFILLDFFCCAAILFPVVWSIRHLQEASQTDGKAATNLRKLKLFRHFYIIVVCYIYFTRVIINMLLNKTVPFQYEWLDELFREMTTFIFFTLTGYKFRPAANNPYLTLAHESDDESEMDVALTESGLTQGVVKRGYKAKKKTLKEIVLFDPNEEETDDDEEVLLEKRREASHDFD